MSEEASQPIGWPSAIPASGMSASATAASAQSAKPAQPRCPGRQSGAPTLGALIASDDRHQAASNELLPKHQDLLPCHPVIETDQTENQFDETQHPSQRR